MPISPVSVAPIPAAGEFPISADAVYEHSFSGLDAEEPDAAPEAPKEGESKKSKAARELREQQKAERKEKRNEAKDAAKAKIKETINQKLSEIGTKLSEIGEASTFLTVQAPYQLGVRAWLLVYDATYIKPLEAQITAMKVVEAMPPDPKAPDASAQAKAGAAQNIATLELQLADVKDKYEQMCITYNTAVAQLKQAAQTIENDVGFIIGVCALLLLLDIGAINTFVGVLGGIVAAATLIAKALQEV